MQPLPGFRDFLPDPLPTRDAWSVEVRRHIFEAWRRTARKYGFREYDGPPLEPTELYTLKSGEEIVQQLFHFEDKGGRQVALRPEMTPTLARLMATHERNYRKPIKWFAIPQLFRYEKQQKGRLREHFQFNADLFGETDPAADAEVIALLIDSLRAVGLTGDDFVIRLSSRLAWQDFYVRHQGHPDRAQAFYQVIDKLERERPEVTDARLTELGMDPMAVRGFLTEGVATPELQVVLENLEARGLRGYVRIDYGVIRGLAYYTGIVFEAFDRAGEFRAIAGGGRYDQLVPLVSGGKVQLPGLGFGMGDVVLTEILKARGRLPASVAVVDTFVMIEDEDLRLASLRLVQQGREAGRSVEYSLTRSKPDKQLKKALELGAGRLLKLERKAEGGLTVCLRDLVTRGESRLEWTAEAPAEALWG